MGRTDRRVQEGTCLRAMLCPWEALAPFGQYGITLDEELRVLKVEGKDIGHLSCHATVMALSVLTCLAASCSRTPRGLAEPAGSAVLGITRDQKPAASEPEVGFARFF